MEKALLRDEKKMGLRNHSRQTWKGLSNITENDTKSNPENIESNFGNTQKNYNHFRLINERLRKIPLGLDISQGPCFISLSHT